MEIEDPKSVKNYFYELPKSILSPFLFPNIFLFLTYFYLKSKISLAGVK